MLQAGRRNTIFTSDDRIDYIENMWIIQLYNTLRLMTGKILIHDISSNTLSREHDHFLMDTWDQNNLPIDTLYQLNLCRLYLRVETLSDIVINDGKTIQRCYLHGLTVKPFSKNEWPIQQKPNPAAWKLLKHHLITTFCRGDNLSMPLGLG